MKAFVSILWFRVVFALVVALCKIEGVTAAPVGCLSIHSDITEGSSVRYADGHSWLQFYPAPGAGLAPFTVGTWGYGYKPVGVHYNEEANRHPGVFRRKEISAQQYKKFLELIQTNNHWGPAENCSYFAKTVWNGVTGEDLDNFTDHEWDRLRYLHEIPMRSPMGLFTSIFRKNGNKFNNAGWQSRDEKDRPSAPYSSPAIEASCDNFDFDRHIQAMRNETFPIPKFR